MRCTGIATGIVSLFALVTPSANGAAFLAYTGSLPTPEDVFVKSFIVLTPGTLVIRTWGFGGGTNAAGQVITAGGFDSMVSLFSGPPASAMIDTVGGNPVADADTLSNPPFSYVGNCPPSGMVNIGGTPACGDVRIALTGVPVGQYTLVLTDANYVPLAVNPGPPGSTNLSDGFTDFTGGVFQTCIDPSTCISPNGNFAVDIVTAETARIAEAPEPAVPALLVLALLAIARKSCSGG
jgi:hypothetical protein